MLGRSQRWGASFLASRLARTLALPDTDTSLRHDLHDFDLASIRSVVPALRAPFSLGGLTLAGYRPVGCTHTRSPRELRQ